MPAPYATSKLKPEIPFCRGMKVRTKVPRAFPMPGKCKMIWRTKLICKGQINLRQSTTSALRCAPDCTVITSPVSLQACALGIDYIRPVAYNKLTSPRSSHHTVILAVQQPHMTFNSSLKLTQLLALKWGWDLRHEACLSILGSAAWLFRWTYLRNKTLDKYR